MFPQCHSNFEFQFHKGTIKPRKKDTHILIMTKFQFHKGTIKPPAAQSFTLPWSHFNSIKVRLNLYRRGALSEAT